MARTRNNLTAVKIRAAAPGRLSDGGGLILDKSEDGTGKWLYRYSIAGRRRDMGLGSYPPVTLADARRARDEWAALLLRGLDPISERERQRAAEKAAIDKTDPTLAEITSIVFEARKAGLRGEGVRGRWRSPLDLHVLPKLGKRRISTLHQADIRDVLAPIWRRKAPTAEKAIQRLGIVLEDAKLAGHEVDPFIVKAARHLLGPQKHVIRHIASTAWQEVPALYRRLDNLSSSHLCLRMMILTAVRTDAASGMALEEIEGDTWTVPADRIKAKEGKAKPFRVPLSAPALEIVETCREFYGRGLLFPGHRGKAISSTGLEKALNTIGEAGRPHGLRASFRSWVQDTRAADWDVAETALGHTVGGEVERTYARSDLLDLRRILMDKWAAYLTASV